jgi:hypothetical protein
VSILESLLDYVQVLHGTQSFDGLDLVAIRLDGKHQAGTHGQTIIQYGAGAANAMFAADVGSSQIQFLAQEIAQQETRVDLAFVFCIIDCDG